MKKLLGCASSRDEKDGPYTRSMSSSSPPSRPPPPLPAESNPRDKGYPPRSPASPTSNSQPAEFRNWTKADVTSHENTRGPSASEAASLLQEDEVVQILLIGKTGNGKSSTGNTLLGQSKNAFEVSTGIVSSPQHTQLHEAVRTRGKGSVKVQVLDFPDVHGVDERSLQREVELCRSLTYPAPSATCLVLRADVRFTPEEFANYRDTRQLLGEGALHNLVIVFTMADKLPTEGKNTFENQLKQANVELLQVLEDARNRYIVLSNVKDGDDDDDNDDDGNVLNAKNEEEVQRLLDIVLDARDARQYNGEAEVPVMADAGRLVPGPETEPVNVDNEDSEIPVVEKEKAKNGNSVQAVVSETGQTEEDDVLLEEPLGSRTAETTSVVEDQNLVPESLDSDTSEQTVAIKAPAPEPGDVSALSDGELDLDLSAAEMKERLKRRKKPDPRLQKSNSFEANSKMFQQM